MKSLKEDGFAEIMEMFAANDVVKKEEKKEDPTSLNKEFEVGDYYVRDGWNNTRRIHRIVDNTIYYQPINEDTKRNSCQNNKNNKGLRKLTSEEIKIALTEEAKRRGYVKGVKFLSELDGDSHESDFGEIQIGEDFGWLYLDGNAIYKMGSWAKIIE